MRLAYQDKKRWRWRWMYTQGQLGGRESRGSVMHRVIRSLGQDKRYGVKTITGKTVCGIKGKFWMPGVLGRIGAQCCKTCCKRLGLPAMQGAPFNRGLNA